MSYSTGAELRKGRPYNGRKQTLEEALDRTYIIKQTKNGTSKTGFTTFPSALIGKRIRIILAPKIEQQDL